MILFNIVRCLNLRKNCLNYQLKYLSSQKKILFTKNEQVTKNMHILFSNKARSQKHLSENFIKLLKFGALFLTGGLSYFLYNYKNKENTIEENISLDLNEIYETCAVLFLSNLQVQEAIGIPIKITSSESDQVREIHLRRQGDQLFSFISYRLQGPNNKGTVYCKLKMLKDTQKFKTVEIILKLDKVFNKKREFIIMGEDIKKNENDKK